MKSRTKWICLALVICIAAGVGIWLLTRNSGTTSETAATATPEITEAPTASPTPRATFTGDYEIDEMGMYAARADDMKDVTVNIAAEDGLIVVTGFVYYGEDAKLQRISWAVEGKASKDIETEDIHFTPGLDSDSADSARWELRKCGTEPGTEGQGPFWIELPKDALEAGSYPLQVSFVFADGQRSTQEIRLNLADDGSGETITDGKEWMTRMGYKGE